MLGRTSNSGSSRYYTPQQQQTQAYSGRWRYASGVAVAQRVNSQGGTYEATSRANLRAAPNQSAAVIDRLQLGEQVEVAGGVTGGWLAVIEDGYIQGYVSSTVVRPVGRSYAGSGDCRVVVSTTTERGGAPMTERFNACRDDRGEWNLTSV